MAARDGHAQASGYLAFGCVRAADGEAVFQREPDEAAHSRAADTHQKERFGFAKRFARSEEFDDFARCSHRAAPMTRSVIVAVALGRSQSARASPALSRRGSSESQVPMAAASAWGEASAS